MVTMATNAEQLRQQIAQTAKDTQALKEYWTSVIPCEAPSNYIIAGWLRQFDFDTIVAGIDSYNVKCSRYEDEAAKGKKAGGPSTAAGVRYASGTMWKIKRGTNRQFEDGTAFPDGWDELDAAAKRQLLAAHRETVQ